MKRLLLVLIVFAQLIFVAGCTSQLERQNLAICGSYAVPGMFCADLKGADYECNIIETDTQGRILYTYVTDSIITGNKERALVICQNSSNDAVWYYENECYLIGTWTSADIEQLKITNDWNQTLNYGKMTHRVNTVSLDSYIIIPCEIDTATLRAACCTHLGIDHSQVLELCFLDADEGGLALYWLCVEKEHNIQRYFILTNKNCEVISTSAQGNLDDLEIVAKFKTDNFWGQGDSSVVPADKS